MSESGIVNVQDYDVLTTNLPLTNSTKLQALVSMMLSSDGPTGGQWWHDPIPFDGDLSVFGIHHYRPR